ncbi:hypothetical protein AHAS_Ahas01G0141400 [Arachis hypogaea]
MFSFDGARTQSASILMSRVVTMSVGWMRVILHLEDYVHTSTMLLKISSMMTTKQHYCMLLWKKQGPS